MSKIICSESLIETHVNDYAGMWRLNHTCAKLRHHISRLTRKTWATTKKMDRLQMHLDLGIFDWLSPYGFLIWHMVSYISSG